MTIKTIRAVELQQLYAIIDQAWAEDYPPELVPADVIGRKAWRKARLLELIHVQFPDGETSP